MWTWKYFPQFWMFGAINNPCQLKNIFRLTIKFWLMRHKMVCAPLKRCKTIYTLKLSNMRPPLPFLQIITITLLSIITPATSNHRWPTPSPTHPQPGTELFLVLGGQWPPLDFQKKILRYMYSILFLVICFNKITLAPLNNIIDIFKCYKKNISPPIKIKPKQHTQKKKIRAGFNEISM